ncbi:SIS domain-containing protein [Roseibium sediminis]|uniref:SIS domain-containing protein n=1 Tax=Roseibium sediminis TaxID=1775174 RepID=UPI00123DC667|nr:SIS domain-containing protein [Roseibium sediminis]
MQSAALKSNETHMRREIEEIPVATRRLFDNGRDAVAKAAETARGARYFATVARGSSDHAATFFKYASEIYLGKPVASIGPSVTSVYKKRVALNGACVLAISQSGASPDLLSLVQDATDQGVPTIGLTNNSDSPLANICTNAIDIAAGPELSVAATKTYVSSAVAALMILADIADDAALKAALDRLPARFEEAIHMDWTAMNAAIDAHGSLYVIGRGPGLAIAHEAALKFKETCQIHGEAYSSAEVLHGPVSIVGENYPVLALAARDEAEEGLAQTADSISGNGALVFATSSRVNSAKVLPHVEDEHPLTDALIQIVSFYSFIEQFAAHRGLNPDTPRFLKKVTQTV